MFHLVHGSSFSNCWWRRAIFPTAASIQSVIFRVFWLTVSWLSKDQPKQSSKGYPQHCFSVQLEHGGQQQRERQHEQQQRQHRQRDAARKEEEEEEGNRKSGRDWPGPEMLPKPRSRPGRCLLGNGPPFAGWQLFGTNEQNLPHLFLKVLFGLPGRSGGPPLC